MAAKHMAILADSEKDFSSDQGSNNWFYGQYRGVFKPVNFELFEYFHYQGEYLWSAEKPYGYNNFNQLTAWGGHPNTQRGKLSWAVRRWVSDFEGDVNITGEVNDLNRRGGGDGITGRIFHNNQEVYSGLVDHSSKPKGTEYDIDLSIKKGDIIDFAIDYNTNDGDDTARFTAIIKNKETRSKPETDINNGNIFNGDIFNGDIGNTGTNNGTIINGDLNVTVDNSVNKNATINLINLYGENIVSRPIFFGGKHVEKMFVDISKFASQKADKIGGTELADFLQMGDGDDEFTGGLGGDSIYGNKGRDILYGNQGDDEIKGNMGDDIIYGGKDADSIYGNLDNDKLYGNIGNDYLYGGQGDDVIYAGKGNDYVYGNKGNDTLYGNKGADTFVCTKGFDVIKDFWGLDGDKISVASVAGAVITEKDGSTLITSGEGQLLLEGFARQFFDESQYLV